MNNMPEKQILNIDLSNPEDADKYEELSPVFTTMVALGLKELTICESIKPEVLKKKFTMEFWEDGEGIGTFTLKDVTDDN